MKNEAFADNPLADLCLSAADFLGVLFAEWNRQGLAWLVLRNHEGFPNDIGNDVDLLIDREHGAEAERILWDVAAGQGWRVHNVVEHACLAVYLHHPSSLEQLHLDLTYALTWHGMVFVDAAALLANRIRQGMVFVPHAAQEAAVNLCMGLYYRGRVKDRYRAGIVRAARAERELFLQALSGSADAMLLSDMHAALANESWAEVESLVGRWRRAHWRRALRDPGSLLTGLAHEVKRYLGRMLRPAGIVLVLLGPDGSGKSSVAEGLQKRLARTFNPAASLRAHWKPIPSDPSCPPTIDPHGRPPRPAWQSCCFFIYHWLYFVMGWWTYVQPKRLHNGLVIIDRYYYDFFVDPLRYRLSLPRWVFRVAFLMVRKPDLVVELNVTPEVAQTRKSEVSDGERARQCEAYHALVATLPQGRSVDANAPLDNVITAVQRIVLEYMTNRAR